MGAVCPRRTNGDDGFLKDLVAKVDHPLDGGVLECSDRNGCATSSASSTSEADAPSDVCSCDHVRLPCMEDHELDLRSQTCADSSSPESCSVDNDGRLVLLEKPGARCAARDAQGGSHRARKWRGTTGYIGTGGPIDAVKHAQRAWLEEHTEQILKWTFPTKQRECLKIGFRAAERTESLTSPEFRVAFGELVQGHSRTVVRTLIYLYLNYLHPHHKKIQAQGRHIMMLKVYEGKSEAHCWHIPLKEVLELHTSSSEAMSGGVSLNDVQLVQTYVIENTFVLHIETFEKDPRRQGNPFGKCTWVGGMVLHLITEENTGNTMDRTREMAMMPDEGMAELTEARCKLREKRARQKEKYKLRKEEEVAVQEAQEKITKEAEVAAQLAKRKEELVQPHESLSQLLRQGGVPSEMPEDGDGCDGLTPEELAMFSNPAPRRKEGLIQPHSSLTMLLRDSAKARN